MRKQSGIEAGLDVARAVCATMEPDGHFTTQVTEGTRVKLSGSPLSTQQCSMSSYQCLQTDVLIIGCGIAGGIAALELAKKGADLTVLTLSEDPEESNTLYAQGGIVYEGIDDSPELLAEDILRAGAGLSSRKAVKVLASEGPGLVRDLLINELRVRFDRATEKELSLVREGGHSIHRILHAADATGSAIEKQLLKSLRGRSGTRILTRHTAIDLLTPAHHSTDHLAVYEPNSCVGAYVLNQTTGDVIRILAKKTILATGGLGQIYLRTTNPPGARGDGLSMAYRAGARVINCEFVQFHPTAFSKQGAPFFLVSEAIRGAGARLVHENGEPFMQNYDQQWKDLAPRDVVSRSIQLEMLNRHVPNVFLDLRSFMSPRQIREDFPSIYENCRRYGVDITKDLVPVVPAAHYFCGGVWVDQWGKTTVENLYAVGEVSCTGVHGANRLASTSLLEGLVWGARAARDIVQHLPSAKSPNPDEIPTWQNTGTEEPDSALIRQDMTVIQHIMWNYTGLIRTSNRLQRAIRELRNLENEIERFYRAVKINDELVGVRNAVRAALIVTLAAWENKTSVGCHYRV